MQCNWVEHLPAVRRVELDWLNVEARDDNQPARGTETLIRSPDARRNRNSGYRHFEATAKRDLDQMTSHT
jgi:hypothetical protein